MPASRFFLKVSTIDFVIAGWPPLIGSGHLECTSKGREPAIAWHRVEQQEQCLHVWGGGARPVLGQHGGCRERAAT